MTRLDTVRGWLSDLRTRNRRIFLGLVLVGGLAGIHLAGPVALAVQYHPNNEFETGDAIGLGFGTSSEVYGQDGISAYHNLDRHTVVANARIYLLGPIYVGVGVAHQAGSSRSVTFDRRTRQIDGVAYDDLGLHIETTLRNQTAPVLAGGAHPTLGGLVGFLVESNFGLTNPKSLDSVSITSTQPLSPAARSALEEAVRADAESEGFGIATAGPTVGLPFAGMGGIVPWSIGGWLWRRRSKDASSRPREEMNT